MVDEEKKMDNEVTDYRWIKRGILAFGIFFGVFTVLLLTPGSWGIQRAIQHILPNIMGLSEQSYSPGALLLCAVMYYWAACSEKGKRPFGFDNSPGYFQVLATWFVLTIGAFLIVLGITCLSFYMDHNL